MSIEKRAKIKNIELPPVYRYLPKRYVDEFFSSGKLRLSAFSEFAKHIDEQRRDTKEGRIRAKITIPSKSKEIMINGGAGRKAYILSTSLRGDVKLMEAFHTDSYFKINNVVAFSEAIASTISECTGLWGGCCTYVSQREIQQWVGTNEDKVVEMILEGKIDKGQIKARFDQMIYPRALFLKLSRYSHQKEFRLIWEVNHEVQEPLDIECREAVPFCQRII